MDNEWRNLVLHGLIREKFDRLEAVWNRLSTPDDVTAFQDRVRRRVWELLGGRPEQKCPLETRVTGTIAADGYRIEKIYFQSLERFYVTANLYVPDNLSAPAPAILCPVGHAMPAKAFPEYQMLFAGLVRRGFVVLAFDPLGQGERGPYYSYHYGDAGGNCHDTQGFQCFLTGRPLAFYFLWDALRAVDVLVSRPEVDPSRIGCTGTSGGGMQTTHLAAVDERIRAAVPVCNTGWPADVFESWMLHPEGNFPDAFDAHGPNNVNLAIGAAPRAQLLIGAGEDHLSAAGIFQLFKKVQTLYRILGAEDRIACTITVDHHGYPSAMRQQAREFFARQLMPRYDPVNDEPAPRIWSPRELWATPDGDVRHLPSASVHEINRDRADHLRRIHEQSPERLTVREWAQRLEKSLLPGGTFEIPCRLTPTETRWRSEPIDREGLPLDVPGRLMQYDLATEAGFVLQRINRYRPIRSGGPWLLFLRDLGYPQCGDLIRRALDRGIQVVTGELHPTDHQRLVLAGLTPAGYYWMLWRKILNELFGRQQGETPDMRMVTRGTLAGLVGLAMGLDYQEHLKSLSLIGTYLSLADAVADPKYQDPDVQCSVGLLETIDLPRVWSVLARPMFIANPKVVPETPISDSEREKIQNALLSRLAPHNAVQVMVEPEERLYALMAGKILK